MFFVVDSSSLMKFSFLKPLFLKILITVVFKSLIAIISRSFIDLFPFVIFALGFKSFGSLLCMPVNFGLDVGYFL